MAKPKVYVDFHNADAQGRVRLNCVGTLEDLSRQQVQLRDGLALALFSDDLYDQGRPDELLVDGVVSFSEQEHCWVAVIDWDAIRHASDLHRSHADARGSSTTAQPSGPARLDT